MIDRNIILSIVLLILLSMYLSNSLVKEKFINLDDLDISNADDYKGFEDIESENPTENSDKSLLAMQDFTTFAIKGQKGEPGAKGDQGPVGNDGPKGSIGPQGESLTGSIKSTGKLWLGSLNSGSSGTNTNGEIQLYLGGSFNQGANNGWGANKTYKLKIDGYDNAGSIVYPIYCSDKNNNVDFSIQSRMTPSSNSNINFGGNVIITPSNAKLTTPNITTSTIETESIIKSNGRIFFENINHNWDGSKDRNDGMATIQNCKDHNSLLIVGRTGSNGIGNRSNEFSRTTVGRHISLYDNVYIGNTLNIKGELKTKSNVNIGGNLTINGTLNAQNCVFKNTTNFEKKATFSNAVECRQNLTCKQVIYSQDGIFDNGSGIYFKNIQHATTSYSSSKDSQKGEASIQNCKTNDALVIRGRYQSKGPKIANRHSASSTRSIYLKDDVSVHGSLRIGGTTFHSGMQQSSDLSLKYNIKKVNNSLNIINSLSPVSYIYKKDKTNKTNYGFIAQNVEQIIPDIVIGSEGNKSVGYTELIPFCVGALQQQQSIITQLIKNNKMLESKLNNLESFISKFNN